MQKVFVGVVFSLTLFISSLSAIGAGGLADASPEQKPGCQTLHTQSASFSPDFEAKHAQAYCNRGPAGPMGPSGATGAQGESGATGATGPSFGQFSSYVNSQIDVIIPNSVITFDTLMSEAGIVYNNNNGSFLIGADGIYTIEIWFLTTNNAFSAGPASADKLQLTLRPFTDSLQRVDITSGIPLKFNTHFNSGNVLWIQGPAGGPSVTLLNDASGRNAYIEIHKINDFIP